MPASNRLTITVTQDIAEALDAAAARWPQIRSRQELLLRVVLEGHSAIKREHVEETERRRAAILRTSGALTDAYEPGYPERLRDDWPP
jgi:hypothetical protein